MSVGSPVGNNRTIELSQWYACVSPASGDLGGPIPPDAIRIGRLTVFRASSGAEIETLDGDRRSAVVFDGYLFDRAALAHELGVSPDVSQATLAARAYARWGSDLFDKLDGAYLIIVWDDAQDRLLIGHDAMGRHPAFYSVQPSGFWCAGNVLALASSGRVPTDPNRLSLALTAYRYWPEAGETFFAQIRRVRPGHHVEVSRGVVAEQRYWNPFPPEDEPWLDDEYVYAEFEPAIERAVSRCMALAPDGIFLSGGVDSVTVAAIAAKQSRAEGRPPLIAVSGRTGEALTGEEIMQSRVVDALGLPHRVSTTLEWRAGRDSIAMSVDVIKELPSPTNIWWVGTYMTFHRRTAADGTRVLLTGSGGDNWLGVADSHAADLLGGGRIPELLTFLRADIRTGGASMRRMLRRRLWAYGIHPHIDSMWARLAPEPKARYHRRKWHERVPAWLCPDATLRHEFVECLLRRRTPALGSGGTKPRSYYRHGLRSAGNPYFHHEFETGYHMSTYCGLQMLSPYHDRRIVSFFNRISPRALMHGGRYKGLLRPIATKYLPGLGLEGQRKDYPVDQEQRRLVELRGSLAAAWTGTNFEALGDLGVIDPATVRRAREAFPSGDFDYLGRMFGLLSADQWVRVKRPS